MPQKGKIKNRIGETFKTNQGYLVKIVEYYGCHNCTIEFENGVRLKNITYGVLKNGGIHNPFHKSVFDTGYLGLGKSIPTKNNIHTDCYLFWYRMLEKCYSKKYKDIRVGNYRNLTVCEEWHNFQNFAEWFNKNYKKGEKLNMKLLRESKIYNPNTLIFIKTK